MINLLPPDHKRELQAARSNALLVRYNLLLLGALVFLLLATGVVYVYLNNAKSRAEQTIAENASKVAGYAAVQSQAQQFRTDLTTAKQLLDQEVRYSKVTLAIAKLMPRGTTLDNLNLDVKTFGTETTLVAQAKNYSSALAMKNAFQNSPLFSDVHFQSISQNSDTDSDYPISVNLNVTIKKDAAK